MNKTGPRKEEIVTKLKAVGIERGCDWRGYERAKAILIGDTPMESSERDRIIAIILEILDL